MSPYVERPLRGVGKRYLRITIDINRRTLDDAPAAYVDVQHGNSDPQTIGVWVLSSGFTAPTISEIETVAFSALESAIEHQWGIQALLL